MNPVNFPCFTQEQVKEINKKIKDNIFEEEISSRVAGEVSKKGNFSVVPCFPLMELIHPWLYQCQQVNIDIFGYDLYWNFHLDTLNYNVYGIKGEYGWHIDVQPYKKYDMKLTCLLNLSEEPYEGGKFCAINDPEEVKFDSGTGLVLNSLIAHKVTPVTKGERITLTYWATGQSWR